MKFIQRFSIFIFSILFGIPVFSNMASPVREGSLITTAFSSREIDIVYEKLGIKINKDLISASFNVEYKIKCDKEGKQIPLLFYAMRLYEGFHVWVDGVEISTLDYTDSIRSRMDGFSQNFNTSLKNVNGGSTSEMVEVDFGPRFRWLQNGNESKELYPLKDLKYFEVDLTKGEHIIRVTYDAVAWIDQGGWIKNYSYRYSLSPARHWKSFGGLEFTLDASALSNTPTLNIGPPQKGSLDSIATWKFDSIPADYIIINHQPDISNYGKTMIKIGPTALAYGWAFLLAALHFLAMYLYRRKYINERFSWVMITGSILLPFFMLLGFHFGYLMIDNAIGEFAARSKDYMSVMMVIFYPILMPLYWAIMWIVDRVLRKKLRKKA